MAWWDSFQDAPPRPGGGWWDKFPDAPKQQAAERNWWDHPKYAPPVAHDRFSQGTPGSGGRPPPRDDQKQLPPYLEGSVEGISRIPRGVMEGARETISGAPERYAAGYGSVDRDAGAFNRVIGAPLAGAYNVVAGSPAGQAAADIGLSGAPLTRGMSNERSARPVVAGHDVDLRVDEGRPRVPESQAGRGVAPQEVRSDVPREGVVLPPKQSILELAESRPETLPYHSSDNPVHLEHLGEEGGTSVFSVKDDYAGDHGVVNASYNPAVKDVRVISMDMRNLDRGMTRAHAESLLSDIKKHYPEAETISGMRITGSRSEMRPNVKMRLPNTQATATGKPAEGGGRIVAPQEVLEEVKGFGPYPYNPAFEQEPFKYRPGEAESARDNRGWSDAYEAELDRNDGRPPAREAGAGGLGPGKVDRSTSLKHIPYSGGDDFENTSLFEINKEGNHIGNIYINHDDPKNLRIDHMESTTAKGHDRLNSLGPSVVKNILLEVRNLYPEAETISGHRISGASRSRLTGEDLKVNLPQRQATATGKPAEGGVEGAELPTSPPYESPRIAGRAPVGNRFPETLFSGEMTPRDRLEAANVFMAESGDYAGAAVAHEGHLRNLIADARSGGGSALSGKGRISGAYVDGIEAELERSIKPTGNRSALEPGSLGAASSPTRPAPAMITEQTGSRPLISQQIGLANRRSAQMNESIEETIKHEFAATPEQRKAYRDYIEKRSTDKSVPKILTPELLAAADLVKSQAGDIRYELERLDPESKQGFIDDYLSHMYKDTPRLREMIGEKARGGSGGGASGHLKQRTIPTYSEAERLGLTPKYDTIGETVQASNKMMNRFIAARDIEDELKAQGFIHEGASGDKVPLGWKRIDSGRFANRPVFAPPNIARDYNRFYKHPDAPWAHTVMEVNNALRGVKFFGPPYHLLTELVETATHDWSSALENIRNAQFGRAAANTSKALTHTGLPANYWRGGRAYRDYLGLRTGPEPGQGMFRKMLETIRGEISPEDSELVNILAQVNAPQARSSIDLFYGDISAARWAGRRGWLKGFKNGVYRVEVGKAGQAAKDFVKGIPGAPLSSAGTLVMAPFRGMAKITSEIMAPLFSELIPKAKFGASMQKLQDWIAANPGASMDQKRMAAAKIRQNSDNLFGEMQEDNQFMNRTVMLAARMTFLSPSWNIGTARWAGGGLKATAQAIGKTAIGKYREAPGISKVGSTWNPAIATTYGAILETVMAGSITTYLLTGRKPNDLRDIVAPPSGGVNERGEPDRIRPFADASFIADISKGLGYPGLGAAGYVPQDVGPLGALKGKLNTIPSIAIDELITGRDYKNKPIFGDHPIEQGIMYALKNALTPISFGEKGAVGAPDKTNIPLWARVIGMGEAGMQFTNPQGWKGLRARDGKPTSVTSTPEYKAAHPRKPNKPMVRHEDSAAYPR